MNSYSCEKMSIQWLLQVYYKVSKNFMIALRLISALFNDWIHDLNHDLTLEVPYDDCSLVVSWL